VYHRFFSPLPRDSIFSEKIAPFYSFVKAPVCFALIFSPVSSFVASLEQYENREVIAIPRTGLFFSAL